MDLSIFFILDGSGSMASVQKEVVDGLNDFIKEQQDEAAVSGDMTVFSLTVFDYTPTIVYMAEDIASVSPVTKKDTFLGGGTALYDAIGTTLSKAKEANLPGKKLVAIYTDGYENSSVEYDAEKVKKLIKELENSNDWTVIFLSAEINDFETAKAMGIAGGNYAVTAGGAQGVTNTLRGVTQATINYKQNAAVTTTNTFLADYGNNTNLDAAILNKLEDEED